MKTLSALLLLVIGSLTACAGTEANDDEDHAEHAVQTALAMITTLDQLNREWDSQGKPQLGIGIGIKGFERGHSHFTGEH